MRIVVIAVGCYFLALVAFFILGLGKILILMFPDLECISLKDAIEVASWIATIVIGIISLLLSVRAYIDAGEYKKLIDAKDALSEVKSQLSNLEDLLVRRNEIINSFALLENRISCLSNTKKRELDNEACVFCRTILRRIKVHHILAVDNDNNELPPGDSLFERNAKDIAKKLLAEKVEKLGDKYFYRGEERADDVLNKLLEFASRGLYLSLRDKWHEQDFNKMKFYAGSFESIPSAIIFLLECKGRNEFFSDIEKTI